MKKSFAIYIHIFIWIVVLSTNFILPISFRYLPHDEFGLMAVYIRLLIPVIFYAGYFLAIKIKWDVRYIISTAVSIAMSLLIVFLVSKKAFGFGLYFLVFIGQWMTFGGVFRVFIDWFKKRNDLLVLEKENIKSNLALMQNQINPHFLFNTLHNIDTLIYHDQEKASKSIVKLSDIMRYMLHDTKSDRVDLGSEITYLENYFELERLRLKNEKFFNYTIKGSSKGLKIAPMMLIPFVENAFKHSMDSNIENGIIVNIAIENRKLFFSCENQYEESGAEKDKTHGIGLVTVQKRLDLIYKNKYKLIIKSDNSVFKVNLELELNEN